MRALDYVGLALWRGGILLVAGYLAYQVLRIVLAITDAELELAVAILLTGVLFVFASLIGERILDAREEKKKGGWE